MTKLHFRYSMKIYYSEVASKCHFTIRCIPRQTARQSLESINIEIYPNVKYSYSLDGFGNRKIIGTVNQSHDYFLLEVTGEVNIEEVSYEEIDYSNQVGIFKYPYGKTVPGTEITEYVRSQYEEISDCANLSDYDKALFIMRRLHDDFSYNPATTDVETTAEEAFCIGSGVCQDYAHIYICIARLLGIPARYVVGYFLGEGKSHAWVEIMDNGKWIGIDPTNNLLVGEDYIKLGHGRDAGDCKINIGILRGGGRQRQEIEVKVWKE